MDRMHTPRAVVVAATLSLLGCRTPPPATDAGRDAVVVTPDAAAMCTPLDGDCAGAMQFSCCASLDCLMVSSGGVTVSRCRP